MYKKIRWCMSFMLILSLFLPFVMFENVYAATNYYVSTGGSDSNSGTSTSTAFKTIEKAVSKASAGSTIYILAGTYTYGTNFSGTIKLSSSGTSSAPITIAAYDSNNKPVLNFSGQSVSSSNQGIYISGSYWVISQLVIKYAGDNGILIKGSSANYNVINSCDIASCSDTGIQISSGAAYNTIKYCTSNYNCDEGEENADGYACKLEPGAGNVIRSCSAKYNSDDGFDLYQCNYPVTITSCQSLYNGYFSDGSVTSGNGEGFKLGGDANYSAAHVVSSCTATGNKTKGFSSNNNPGHTVLTDCKAYQPASIASGVTYYNFNMINGKITATNCYSYTSSGSNSSKYRILSGSTISGGNVTATY